MKPRLAYIISNIDKSLGFEWTAEQLKQTHHDLIFILLNAQNSILEDFLRSKQITVFRVDYTGKKDLIKAFLEVRRILKKNNIQTIHCHLFDASLIGLMAGLSLGIKKRIFTRHYATFHHEYFPRAVYYDKFINFLATDIVAISKNVANVLINKEKVQPKKVHIVHHGFNLEIFENIDEQILQNFKDKYTQNHAPVIGIVARYIHLKGIQCIIPAFKEVLLKYPKAHLLLANATGDYKTNIEELLKDIPKENYTEVVFEANLTHLYAVMDVYVHTPINAEVEAYGQTYVEALAAGIPSVFTLSGVANEFIEHKKNALVVPFQDVEAIKKAIFEILKNNTLRQQLIKQGKQDVKHLFQLHIMIEKLNNLY
jgi:glycosyltransferase involved in cell wall biosynthesis